MKAPRWLYLSLLSGLACVAFTWRSPRVPSAAYKLSKHGEVAQILAARDNQRPPDPRQAAEDLLALGNDQNSTDHILAEQTAQTALKAWEALGDQAGIARAYALIGRCQLAQSSLTEASESYERALALWRQLSNTREEAATLISLGNVEARKAEWENAISFYMQAQNLIDEKESPTMMGQIAGGLAYVFNESGMFEQGLLQYQRALEYYRQTPDPNDDAGIIRALGSTYYFAGKYAEALTHLQQALDAFPPGDSRWAYCHEYLGRTYAEMGDYDRALEHLQTSLNVYRPAGNVMEGARVTTLIGRVHQERGEINQARKYYQQAIEEFGKLSDHLNEAAVYYAWGRLELNQGDLDKAANYLKQSIDATEQVRRIPTSRDLAVAFSASVQERYETYIECLMRRHGQKPNESLDVRAFEMSELARGRSLAELLRATQTSLLGGVDPALAEEERTIRQSLRVKEDDRVALLGTAYKKRELDALNSELARLESNYQRVQQHIRNVYPAYGEIVEPSASSLQQIREAVLTDDQTLLLEFSLGQRRSYLWAVSRTGFSSFELPARDEIEKSAMRVYALLTATQPNPGETFAQHQARQRQADELLPSEMTKLSNLVLAPVSNMLGTKRLIIVADGALQYIPFQALTLDTQMADSDPNSLRPLILDHEIINQPSASVLALVKREAAAHPRSSQSVAIIADPVFETSDPRVKNGPPSSPPVKSSNVLAAIFRNRGTMTDSRYPRLLGSREEAQAIMQTVPSYTSLSALDFDANRSLASSASLAQYRIVHFATHAVLDDNHPEFSRIVLSLVDAEGKPQDGLLRMSDIYALKMPIDLVVLSGCQTGLGKNARGEGLIGLTRGFMYAGASSIAASLWKVDDEATAELMKGFYRGMFQKDLPPSAALREAQIAMWHQKRWHAPYYWAAFVIQGRYDQKETVASPSAQTAVMVAGFLSVCLLAACLVIGRRRSSAV